MMNEIAESVAGHVRILEIYRPPNNFFDEPLVTALADHFEACDRDDDVRAILLCSEGKNFCAGANFAGVDGAATAMAAARLYRQAVRLFAGAKPIVAAVQGGAIGGGLGLAMVADFRVASPETWFSANFTRLGIHPGFGLTATLPRAIGTQAAASLFYTGRRINGEEAARLGLVDHLVPTSTLRSAALEFAMELAQSAPLAVVATRATLRLGLTEQVSAAMEREIAAQAKHFETDDFREGVAAAAARRLPLFRQR